MKIQNVSDLHLEFGPITIQNAGADVLILSGDIAVTKDINRPDPDGILQELPRSRMFKSFFRNISAEFNDIVYVFGNHEHYHGEINESFRIMREMLDDQNIFNVHLLENDTVTIDDVIFVGGTLWTDCNKEDPITIFDLKNLMNDYVIVQYGDSRLLPEDTVEFHKKTLGFIKNIVTANGNKKIVVVGHHAPSKQSTHPRYKNEPIMNGGYSSDLSDFILDNPNIKLWTHGHTHESFDYMIGATRILCNPRGYVGHDINRTFDPGKIVEI